MTAAREAQQEGTPPRRPLWWAVVLAVAVVVVAPGGVWAAEMLTDSVEGQGRHAALASVRDAGITPGCLAGRSCPEATVQRDQTAPVMARLDALETQLADADARIGELEAANTALEGRVADLEATDRPDDAADPDPPTRPSSDHEVPCDEGGRCQDSALQQQVDALEDLLAGVTRADDAGGGDTLTFSGMNVQVVNGTASTDGSPNGLGNLIIGYNAARSGGTEPAVDRAGSHYLVVGDQHHWTSYGGILAGVSNTASGLWASVTGGSSNTASGTRASVTGGSNNTASGGHASVTGGFANTASNVVSSVTGGDSNTASGDRSSVAGGFENTASDSAASVAGGRGNTASGRFTSVAGGRDGSVAGQYDSRIGNTDFPDS